VVRPAVGLQGQRRGPLPVPRARPPSRASSAWRPKPASAVSAIRPASRRPAGAGRRWHTAHLPLATCGATPIWTAAI